MLRATQLLLIDLRWINFKKSLQSTTRNAEVAVCHPPRKWVKDVWTARFFSLRYLSDPQKIQIGVDLIAILGEVHWMPFQHQIIQSDTLWKCWQVKLVIVFPPEYNVHNIAGFFSSTFLAVETFVEPVENDLLDTWWTANQADRGSAGIHYIFLPGAHLELCSYVFEEAGLGGREERILPSEEDSLLLRSGKSLDPCPLGFRAIAFTIQRGDESQKGWQVV